MSLSSDGVISQKSGQRANLWPFLLDLSLQNDIQ
jgi:hypothetical protein